MNEPHYDVLGLGAIAVDDILFVDEYPPAEAKIRVRRRVRVAGGLTGNALVAAARLGARCGYAGLVGDDELSQFVKQTFDREGVDYRHATVRPDARPAHSTIIVDIRRHTRTIFSSAEGALGPDDTQPTEDVLRFTKALLIDHHGLEGTLRAARIARQAGVAVVADVERNPCAPHSLREKSCRTERDEYVDGPFAAVLALVDHLVISQRFARELSGVNASASSCPTLRASDVTAICQRLWRDDRQAIVVTCGAEGCFYYAGHEAQPQHFPAFAIDVVDTTGCGDVFHGAYCAGLAFGMPLAERVRFASAAAAIKATQPGGAGAPNRAAVDTLLDSRSGH